MDAHGLTKQHWLELLYDKSGLFRIRIIGDEEAGAASWRFSLGAAAGGSGVSTRATDPVPTAVVDNVLRGTGGPFARAAVPPEASGQARRAS